MEDVVSAGAAAALGPKRAAAERNIGHLPRIEQVIEFQSTQCPRGCGEMARIGEIAPSGWTLCPLSFG